MYAASGTDPTIPDEYAVYRGLVQCSYRDAR
jgi:hypothetical protein